MKILAKAEAWPSSLSKGKGVVVAGISLIVLVEITAHPSFSVKLTGDGMQC